MKGALGASLSAETAAFQARLDKADAHAATFELNSSQSKEDGISEVFSEKAIADDRVVNENEAAPIARVMREAFTIPEGEHAQIETIRATMLSQAVAVSKSEVLRAGLLLLSQADVHTQQQIFERLERVKTGRPKTV